MPTINEHYEGIRALPVQEKLRLLELLARDLAKAIEAEREAERDTAGPPLMGLWADEADLVDDLVEGAMRTREGRTLRATDG